MSAFLVSYTHIDALLTFAKRPRYNSDFGYYWDGVKKPLTKDTIDMIGQILLNQNYASVNKRYDKLDMPPKYKYTFYPDELTPVQVIKLCDCLEYQSCEIEHWKDTEALVILEAIRDRAIKELPGYDSAEWAI